MNEREAFEEFIFKNQFTADYPNGDYEAVISVDDLREFMQAALASQSGLVVYQCLRCATSMQVDESAKAQGEQNE
jgi:hypothetical protein